MKSCPKCEMLDFTSELLTFRDGTQHISARCRVHGTFLGYLPQPVSVFKMPFGKHRGQGLEFIFANDPEYFSWCQENLKPNLARKFTEFCVSAKTP